MRALLLLLAASGAQAGQLGQFSEALKQSAPKAEAAPATPSGASLNLGGSDCQPLLLCAFLQIAAAASGPTLEYAASRPKNMPLVPLARLDAAYQLIPKDVDALSGRLELGRGPFGVAYERILFREKEPHERLWGWRAEALYRLAVGEGMRLDGAAGFMGFTRDGDHSGGSVGVSLGYYPTRSVGYEADLRWGSIGDATASDLRGRLYLGPKSWKGFALRPGYRGIRTGDATLHGPELTVSYTW